MKEDWIFVRKTIEDKSLYLLPCGHTVEKRNAQMKNNSYRCDLCFENKLRTDAEKTGVLEFVSSEKGKGSYKRYKFLSCGHEKSYQSNVIKNSKNFNCDECRNLRLEKEASERGCEILNTETNCRLSFLYLLSCGCQKQIRVDHMREGNFKCQICKPDRYAKKSEVYLFELTDRGFTWLKFGFSRNTYLRFRNLGLSEDAKCNVIYSKKFTTGQEALNWEVEVHSNFSEFKLQKEKMKEFMINGFTECYPLEIKEKFLNFLKEKELKNE